VRSVSHRRGVWGTARGTYRVGSVHCTACAEIASGARSVVASCCRMQLCACLGMVGVGVGVGLVSVRLQALTG
jgi:hypothetical protein